MTFQLRVSLHILGLLSDKEFPATAIIGLEEGWDSESLRILGGLEETESPFKLYDYFKTALREVQIDERSELDALKQIATYYAFKVVKEGVDPYEGFREINKVVRKTRYNHDDIGLWDHYGAFTNIEELQSESFEVDKSLGRSREEWIDVVKKDLYAQFAVWLKETGSA